MNTNRDRLLNVIACITIFVISFCGCVTVKDEIFLQNVELGGPISQLPIHVTDVDMKSKTFSVSPHISVSSQRSVTTTLERQYTGTIPDTLVDFKRAGLQWDVPPV